MKTHPCQHPVVLVITFLLITGLASSRAQQFYRSVSEEEAKVVDSLVAEEENLDPVAFHKLHTFITESGTEYDIYLAVASSSEEASGGQFSAYSWQHKLTAVEEAVLTDSIPNSCISIVDLDDYNTTEAYQTSAENHWIDCGYVTGNSNRPAKTGFDIYPNPSPGDFYVKTEQPMSFILIKDIAGRTVYQQHIAIQPGKSHYISADILPGLYIIKAFNGKSLSGSARMIIK